MAEHVERWWRPDDAGGLSRKDRTPGRYLAYVPDELGDHLPILGAGGAVGRGGRAGGARAGR